jgi:adenylate kinase family enzyme
MGQDDPRRNIGGAMRPQRISVVGNTGSGKTTLARQLADQMRVPVVELDALMHQADWRPLPREAFHDAVDRATVGPSWVVDGNYREVVMEGQVWPRADTVVWLDLPRHVIVRQVVGRTVRRVITREELWNGNREPFSNLWSTDPQNSVIAWAWTQHRKYSERYASAMTDRRWSHIEFVRLRSRAESAIWLANLPV